MYQHLGYFAFGGTFVEEHSNTNRTPYLFNGKELDEETGLYYYGARYYDEQTSIFLSDLPVDTIFIGKGGKVLGSFIDEDEVSFDNKFIILRQKPLNKICECNSSCFEEMTSNDKKNYAECKDALKKSNLYQYWIINKSNNAVFGPYNKGEYLKKREELGVPENLSLSFEDC